MTTVHNNAMDNAMDTDADTGVAPFAAHDELTATDPATHETPDSAYRMSRDDEAALLRGAPWRRMVVIGDSIAEGIGEATEGFPDQGWADSLAEALHRANPGLVYLNLGKRDLRADAIRATQLDPALAFDPDLAVVVAGGNDLLRGRFEIEPVAEHIEVMVAAFKGAGADVVTLGMYDCTGSPYVPEEFRAHMAERIHELSDRTWEIARAYGAVHIDCTNNPGSADPAIYGSDGLHGNRRGHSFTAGVAIRTIGARLGNSA